MPTHQKLKVYYFSGTGNSRNVAYWLNNVAVEKHIECQLINIARIDRLSIEPPEPNTLIVFVSPIHGFNYPPVMLQFIRRFPKGKNRVVLMNTRAGMLIGKCITPGITGIAFYLSACILKLKGYSIQSFFPVDLPSNWISLHPGLNEKTVKFLHEKNKIKVTAFAEEMLKGKSNFKAMREIYDLFLAPISLAYYFIGRFFFAKTFYASRDCNNCEICIKGCPVKAIIKVDNRPFWTFKCESCMKCMSDCPNKAIETGHGFIIGFILIFEFVLLGLFYKYLNLYLFHLENEILKIAIESALFLTLLALWYRIVQSLIRFKFFERLIVYTSLTKFKFWGRRYKALRETKTEDVNN